MPKIEVSDETYEKIKDQLVEEDSKIVAVVELGAKVIIRTRSAGVFFGELSKYKYGETTCILHDAIRLWYWDGACSLSQLAMEGTKVPDNCKFAVPVKEVILNEVIEILAATNKAIKSIKNTKSWKK